MNLWKIQQGVTPNMSALPISKDPCNIWSQSSQLLTIINKGWWAHLPRMMMIGGPIFESKVDFNNSSPAQIKQQDSKRNSSNSCQTSNNNDGARTNTSTDQRKMNRDERKFMDKLQNQGMRLKKCKEVSGETWIMKNYFEELLLKKGTTLKKCYNIQSTK